mgnify:FL=1|tara:strand:- start:55 stop:240 length:186 start_codon:yes stop_codon:yes gene_type:complete
MSSSINTENNQIEVHNSQTKVKVTDLLSRLNEEKRIEKKRNLALGVAAVSAVTVFGIILTI